MHLYVWTYFYHNLPLDCKKKDSRLRIIRPPYKEELETLEAYN